MGKSSLIIVLGLSVIVAFFILKLNANSKESLSTTIDMYKQTHARQIANSGVEIYLDKLYFNPSMINNTYQNNELMNGSYDVILTGSYQNVKVTSTATFMDITHTSVVHASLVDIAAPDMLGVLYLPTSAIVWSNTGNATLNINGHNHDWDGFLDSSFASTYGIYVNNQTDKTQIVSKLAKNKNAFIYGLGDDIEPYSIGVGGIVYENEKWKLLSELLASAAGSNVFDSKSKIPIILGTKEEPIVAVINEPDPTKSVSLNNLEGSGILVVNGSISIAGNFKWHGLILAYKDSKMSIQLTGQATIIGAILATGNTIEFLGQGTVDLKYSKQTIQYVFNQATPLGYKITSWWE